LNRRQKYARAEKSRKAHLSAQLIFLPSFRWAANRGAHPGRAEAAAAKAGQAKSKWIKPMSESHPTGNQYATTLK
jgi:hypothetical protein